jgi:pyrimidine-nucleoside phosphorylase
VLTAMDAPLGRAVGNALEVRECLETRRGHGPADVEELSVHLAACMVYLGGEVSLAEAGTRVRQALTSGQGLEKLRQVIERQGGDARVVDDLRLLPAAPHQTLVRASQPGYVIGVDAEKVGHATMLLGAGRHRVEDAVDPSVGVIIKAVPGEQVADGAAMAEVHYRRTEHLSEAVRILEGAWQIGDAPPSVMPLILGTMGE